MALANPSSRLRDAPRVPRPGRLFPIPDAPTKFVPTETRPYVLEVTRRAVARDRLHQSQPWRRSNRHCPPCGPRAITNLIPPDLAPRADRRIRTHHSRLPAAAGARRAIGGWAMAHRSSCAWQVDTGRHSGEANSGAPMADEVGRRQSRGGIGPPFAKPGFFDRRRRPRRKLPQISVHAFWLPALLL